MQRGKNGYMRAKGHMKMKGPTEVNGKRDGVTKFCSNLFPALPLSK